MEQMVFSEAEAGCRYIAYIAGALANARGVCAEICAVPASSAPQGWGGRSARSCWRR